MKELQIRGPAGPLTGQVTVPGDKSIGHRAVILAALCDGSVQVRGLSGGEDNRRTVAALSALGVSIRTTGDAGGELLVVEGRGMGGLTAPAAALDCGNSGTSMRLLCGLLASQPFATRLCGDEYLHARPMRRVVEPLRRMGARIDGQSGKRPGEIYPPLAIEGARAGQRLTGGRFESEVASAQVKSALLLAGLRAEGPTTVVEPTRSRDHSERMLRHLGAPLTVDGRAVTLDPRGWDGRLHAGVLEVPGDLSSAAFLLGAACIVPGSRVTVRGVGINPTRTGFLDALRAMGGLVELAEVREQAGEPVADLTACASALHGIEIAGELAVRAIDELPLLAALAAHAAGTTTIRDAAELRVKESDRVAATCALLRAFGVEVEERPDGLVVEGRRELRGAAVESHGDHRIAMAGAVCALGAAGPTVVRDVENVATSFPSFARLLASLGASIET